MVKQIPLETKFYKGAKRLGAGGAKRLGGERESGRNDSGAKQLRAKGKVGETTRGERESGRNDPDSLDRVKRIEHEIECSQFCAIKHGYFCI